MTVTPPPAWAALDSALGQRRPVKVTYHGHQRLVCPHALGWKNGRPKLLGYQTAGHTSTGMLPADPRRRWRNFFVDEIDHITTGEPDSAWATADNYDASRPFNATDEVAVAIPDPTTAGLGNTRRRPKHHR